MRGWRMNGLGLEMRMGVLWVDVDSSIKFKCHRD